MARPGQAAIAEPDGRRRDPRLARAERAGGGRADRPAAGSPGPGLPVHHEHPRPAGRARTVRRHHPQDRRGRRGHLPQGRGPDRTGGQESGLHPDAGRQAGGGPGDLPVAGLERPGRGRPHQGQDARTGKTLPQGRALRHRLRHHALRPRIRRRGVPYAARRGHPGGHRRPACSCRTGSPCSCP